MEENQAQQDIQQEPKKEDFKAKVLNFVDDVHN